MKNTFIIAIGIFCIQGNSFAQQTIESVLSSIETNNLKLQAVKKAGEAQNIQNSTGLTLENPQVNYDYMIGRPVGAGNQTDIVVSQSFDFPSVYMHKKELSLEKNKLSDLSYQAERKQMLFEAKAVCIDQIYRNKLASQYTQRKKSLEILVANYQKKLDKGESTIIEVNKAQLQLIELNKEIEMNNSMIRQNNEKLSAFNGGIAIQLTDTLYPVNQINPDLEQLYAQVQQNDPYLKLAEQDNVIALKQIELSKALTLPKFEFGYHYQGILGQRFNGAHAAMTIPLWEHKNTIKATQASSETLELEKQVYLNERKNELKNIFEKYITLKKTLEQYQSVFTTFSNTDLLLKALNLGEINTIEYFQELNYYYKIYNSYMSIE
ncbi:MAG: TolC family protein [Fluviicola sp.]|nr:TolC family protein [Fluviicola sp.]